MTRLALICGTNPIVEAITSRLQGVALDYGPLHQSLPACDGAVCFAPHFRPAPIPGAGRNDVFDAIECALAIGKPLLIATQDGLSAETLRSLSNLPNASALLTIANVDRYLPSRRLIRQNLDDGKLGAPGLVRIHRWQTAVNEDVRLRDLDLIAWYAGAMPQVIFACAHARGTQIHLGFASGCMALLDQAIVPAGEPYYSLSLIGAHGAAYLDDHQNMQLVYRGGPASTIRAEEGFGQWATLVQEFATELAATCERRSERSNFEAALAMAEAVEASLRTGQSVPVKGTR